MTRFDMAPYRVNIGSNRVFCETLEEAARIVIQHGGGAIYRPAGKLYRTISGREQAAAVETARAK